MVELTLAFRLHILLFGLDRLLEFNLKILHQHGLVQNIRWKSYGQNDLLSRHNLSWIPKPSEIQLSRVQTQNTLIHVGLTPMTWLYFFNERIEIFLFIPISALRWSFVLGITTLRKFGTSKQWSSIPLQNTIILQASPIFSNIRPIILTLPLKIGSQITSDPTLPYFSIPYLFIMLPSAWLLLFDRTFQQKLL